MDQLFTAWDHSSEIRSNFCAEHKYEAREADFSSFPENLSSSIIKFLGTQGITKLFSHQRKCWDLLQSENHVVLTTGTASGKSLAYNLPILDMLLKDPSSTALMIFPTKALSNDQKIFLDDASRDLEIHTLDHLAGETQQDIVYSYTGDDSSSSRSKAKKKARILLTNPDMLSLGILPHHPIWAKFLAGLKYIVLDEVHSYRGVWGSHVANIFRRMNRITRFYKSDPQYILTSATISNPKEFAELLIDKPVSIIHENGAPLGEKAFRIFNPPFINKELGIRKGIIDSSIQLSRELLLRRIQTLVFCITRKTVELALKRIQEQYPDLSKLAKSYRSGYLPEKRKSIENELKSSKLTLLFSTNALELGIDIGQLDCVIIAGYPGTIASLTQQAGRAGRKNSASAVVFIASGAPIDQYITTHPEYIFANTPEKALINPYNPLILLNHLECSLFELPFHPGDRYGQLAWEELKEYLEIICDLNLGARSDNKYSWLADIYPASNLSLRTASSSIISLEYMENKEKTILGIVDQLSANWMVHPGAVYFQEGQAYSVQELDHEKGTATLIPLPDEISYYTEPAQSFQVEVLQNIKTEKTAWGNIFLSDVQITTQVIGYKVIDWITKETKKLISQEMPVNTIRTFAYWMSINNETVNFLIKNRLWTSANIDYGPNWKQQKLMVKERDQHKCQNCGASETVIPHQVHHKVPFRQFASYLQANELSNLITLCPKCHRLAESFVKTHTSLSGLSYSMSQLAPLIVMCDTRDIGCISDINSEFSQGQPYVMIYDTIPAGVGLAQELYLHHQALALRAFDLVSACQCYNGCPSCIGPSGPEGIGSKAEVKAILNILAKKTMTNGISVG